MKVWVRVVAGNNTPTLLWHFLEWLAGICDNEIETREIADFFWAKLCQWSMIANDKRFTARIRRSEFPWEGISWKGCFCRLWSHLFKEINAQANHKKTLHGFVNRLLSIFWKRSHAGEEQSYFLTEVYVASKEGPHDSATEARRFCEQKIL